MFFNLKKTDKSTKARLGAIHTSHGVIESPFFMPVGTRATVRTLSSEDLHQIGASIELSNAYHLYIRPGLDVIANAGGLHKFMNWPRPILTDSGGFQVFSLQKKSIKEEGAEFKDQKGAKILLSPETSITIQQNLGSDIMMAFDECIPYPATRDYVVNSMARTHRWLDRCIEAWDNPEQALFGIIQGSTYEDLRVECVKEVVKRCSPEERKVALEARAQQHSHDQSKTAMHQVSQQGLRAQQAMAGRASFPVRAASMQQQAVSRTY